MTRLLIAAAAALVTASALHAQAPAPFKLGTFQQRGVRSSESSGTRQSSI